jgi:ubiquinone/menaquinone biosynthesis C-methylase UbiE
LAQALAKTQLADFDAETHWEKAAKTRMGKYLTRVEANFILNSVDLSRVDTILDIGAEAGRFSQLSKDENVMVVGLDLDPYSLKRLRLKTRQVNVIQADARKIPMKDETFDAIFMIEVLDYIPELDAALRESHRTLKSNASLVATFGNKSSFKSKLRALRGKPYLHSYRKVMQSLLRAGFKAKRKTGYNWLPFGRMSENRLIPLLATTERAFALRRIPRLSPWVIVHAAKSSHANLQQLDKIDPFGKP